MWEEQTCASVDNDYDRLIVIPNDYIYLNIYMLAQLPCLYQYIDRRISSGNHHAMIIDITIKIIALLSCDDVCKVKWIRFEFQSICVIDPG